MSEIIYKDQYYFLLTFGPKKAVQNTAAFTSDYYFQRWDRCWFIVLLEQRWYIITTKVECTWSYSKIDYSFERKFLSDIMWEILFSLQIFFYLMEKNPFEFVHQKLILVQIVSKLIATSLTSQLSSLCKKMSGQSVTKTMSKNLAKHYKNDNKEVDLSRRPHCCFFLDRDQREKNSVNSIGVTYIKNMRVPSFGLNEPIWFPTRSLKIDGLHAWWLVRWSTPLYRGNEMWGF